MSTGSSVGDSGWRIGIPLDGLAERAIQLHEAMKKAVTVGQASEILNAAAHTARDKKGAYNHFPVVAQYIDGLLRSRDVNWHETRTTARGLNRSGES